MKTKFTLSICLAICLAISNLYSQFPVSSINNGENMGSARNKLNTIIGYCNSIHGLVVAGVTASSPLNSSGGITPNISISSTIPTTLGGTGLTSFTTGDIIYASNSSTLSKLAGIASNNVLHSNGTGVAPSYGKVSLTSDISGTLPIASGGSNGTSFTNNRFLFFNGTRFSSLPNNTINITSSSIDWTYSFINEGTVYYGSSYGSALVGYDADATLTTDVSYVIITAGSSYTLPNTSIFDGFILTIKNAQPVVTAIINADTGEGIDASTSYSILPYGCVTMLGSGGQWYVLSKF